MQYGIVRAAVEKATGQRYAIKSISKHRAAVAQQDYIQRIRTEVEILYHLGGHPNIVQLYDVFEDSEQIHLLMELCEGGDFFDQLLCGGAFSELQAAKAVHSVLKTLSYCHRLGVVHRDIKPENLLYTDRTPDAAVKLADFGLSAMTASTSQPAGSPDTRAVHKVVGSAIYLAPEALKSQGNKPSRDIWSLGVVLFISLSGYPPFDGNHIQEVFDAIMNQPLKFEDPTWDHISVNAKDFIRRMLCKDPDRRATIGELMAHPFLRSCVTGSSALGKRAASAAVPGTVVSRLRHFAAMNRFQKEARKVVSSLLPQEEVAGLLHIFHEIDADGDGYITLPELQACLHSHRVRLTEAQSQEMLRCADLNHDNKIDYQEFLAATIHKMHLAKDDLMMKAFRHFDRDGTGFIQREDLRAALSYQGLQVDLDALLSDIDKDGDGRISYDEFCRCVRDKEQQSDESSLWALISSSLSVRGSLMASQSIRRRDLMTSISQKPRGAGGAGRVVHFKDSLKSVNEDSAARHQSLDELPRASTSAAAAAAAAAARAASSVPPSLNGTMERAGELQASWGGGDVGREAREARDRNRLFAGGATPPDGGGARRLPLTPEKMEEGRSRRNSAVYKSIVLDRAADELAAATAAARSQASDASCSSPADLMRERSRLGRQPSSLGLLVRDASYSYRRAESGTLRRGGSLLVRDSSRRVTMAAPDVETSGSGSGSDAAAMAAAAAQASVAGAQPLVLPAIQLSSSASMGRRGSPGGPRLGSGRGGRGSASASPQPHASSPHAPVPPSMPRSSSLRSHVTRPRSSSRSLPLNVMPEARVSPTLHPASYAPCQKGTAAMLQEQELQQAQQQVQQAAASGGTPRRSLHISPSRLSRMQHATPASPRGRSPDPAGSPALAADAAADGGEQAHRRGSASASRPSRRRRSSRRMSRGNSSRGSSMSRGLSRGPSSRGGSVCSSRGSSVGSRGLSRGPSRGSSLGRSRCASTLLFRGPSVLRGSADPQATALPPVTAPTPRRPSQGGGGSGDGGGGGGGGGGGHGTPHVPPLPPGTRVSSPRPTLSFRRSTGGGFPAPGLGHESPVLSSPSGARPSVERLRLDVHTSPVTSSGRRFWDDEDIAGVERSSASRGPSRLGSLAARGARPLQQSDSGKPGASSRDLRASVLLSQQGSLGRPSSAMLAQILQEWEGEALPGGTGDMGGTCGAGGTGGAGGTCGTSDPQRSRHSITQQAAVTSPMFRRMTTNQ